MLAVSSKPWEIQMNRKSLKFLSGLSRNFKAYWQMRRGLDDLVMTYNKGGRPQDEKKLAATPGTYRKTQGEYRLQYAVDPVQHVIFIIDIDKKDNFEYKK